MSQAQTRPSPRDVTRPLWPQCFYAAMGFEIFDPTELAQFIAAETRANDNDGEGAEIVMGEPNSTLATAALQYLNQVKEAKQ